VFALFKAKLQKFVNTHVIRESVFSDLTVSWSVHVKNCGVLTTIGLLIQIRSKDWIGLNWHSTEAS